jgi:hypothetical protein
MLEQFSAFLRGCSTLSAWTLLLSVFLKKKKNRDFYERRPASLIPASLQQFLKWIGIAGSEQRLAVQIPAAQKRKLAFYLE